MIKVTFDTNVWRKVISPEDHSTDPFAEAYAIIHQAIKDQRVSPYVSETIFTLEAIEKKNRLDFLRKDKPNINFKEYDTEDGGFGVTITIRPNDDIHPGNNEYLRTYLEKALELGFKIVPIPRVGGITNPDIEPFLYDMTDDEFQIIGSVCTAIEGREAGIFNAMEIGRIYDNDAPYVGLGKALDIDNKKIAIAMAEWSDGDSVAAHIGIKGDYFCTNDRARGAGNKSILSQANLNWLQETYGFKAISPVDLAALLI